MSKDDLSFFKPHSNSNEALLTLQPENFSKSSKENIHLQKEVQLLSRKRLGNHLEHKTGSASSFDRKKFDKNVVTPSDIGHKHSFLSEKSDSGQRLPQSAASIHSRRRMKVRTGSGSSKTHIRADWSNGLKGISSFAVVQPDEPELKRRDSELKVSEAQSDMVCCNSTAGFGKYPGAQKSWQQRDELTSAESQHETIDNTPTTYNTKGNQSPFGGFQTHCSDNKEVKSNMPREGAENEERNKLMEFTLSGFPLEGVMAQNKQRDSSTSVGKARLQVVRPFNSNRLPSKEAEKEKENDKYSAQSKRLASEKEGTNKENAVSMTEMNDRKSGRRREKQNLILDLKKARNTDTEPTGMYSNREERENIHGARKSQLRLPLQDEAAPGNKSLETSQERGKGTRRREHEKAVPSLEYGKSPLVLMNLALNKKAKSDYAGHGNISPGVKKLVEENSNLRKENSQKEELIGILITALKQKEGMTSDLSPTTLPNLESYLSPKERTQRFNFSRARLTSAEKPFSGTPSQFKPLGLIAPKRDGLDEIVAVERGKSNEGLRLFESSSSLKPMANPSQPKSQPITVIDQLRPTQSVTDILSAKRMYSSPLPVHPEQENLSLPPGFPSGRVPSQKNIILKNNTCHHPLVNLKSSLTSNGRVLVNYPANQEGKYEFEPLPKINLNEYEYGFQRRKSRDSEYNLKSNVPEIKVLSANNLDVISSTKLKESTPLTTTFNPAEFISATFQNKNFRVKSPVQPGKLKCNSQLVVEEGRVQEARYQSACEIDASTLLSSNREAELPGLKVANGIREVKSYGNLQKENPVREGLRLQNMYKNNENHRYEGFERDEKDVQDVGRVKQKSEGGKKEKFPKEVFTMNIRRKFFC